MTASWVPSGWAARCRAHQAGDVPEGARDCAAGRCSSVAPGRPGSHRSGCRGRARCRHDSRKRACQHRFGGAAAAAAAAAAATTT
eukprot:scaffold6450_cov415-Prasinococcus_capsulatus_cf.AAC.12